jgi:hypothetical protein
MVQWAEAGIEEAVEEMVAYFGRLRRSVKPAPMPHGHGMEDY